VIAALGALSGPLHDGAPARVLDMLEAIGLPRQLFTPTFAVSRVVGWTAHIMEQARNNKIIRPAARYVGPQPSRGLTT
jgi:citrate synthase